MKMYTVYVKVNLDPGTPHYDQRLREVIRSLKGRGTMLWLNLTSWDKTFAPSAREGDAVAAPLIREIADLAHQSGIRVMLYPHVWFWLESVPHAIELVKKVRRPNVGITFNLVVDRWWTRGDKVEIQLPFTLRMEKNSGQSPSDCTSLRPRRAGRATRQGELAR